MRNVPFAFLNEETIDRINRAEKAYAGQVQVDAFANLASTQMSMRGMIALPAGAALKTAAKRVVAMLEKMMEMSGPNSIANLERALRAHGVAPRSEAE
jgi:acyl CoA:acetate/3-ketoacid CoA transferase beta subunit